MGFSQGVNTGWATTVVPDYLKMYMEELERRRNEQARIETEALLGTPEARSAYETAESPYAKNTAADMLAWQKEIAQRRITGSKVLGEVKEVPAPGIMGFFGKKLPGQYAPNFLSEIRKQQAMSQAGGERPRRPLGAMGAEEALAAMSLEEGNRPMVATGQETPGGPFRSGVELPSTQPGPRLSYPGVWAGGEAPLGAAPPVPGGGARRPVMPGQPPTGGSPSPMRARPPSGPQMMPPVSQREALAPYFARFGTMPPSLYAAQAMEGMTGETPSVGGLAGALGSTPRMISEGLQGRTAIPRPALPPPGGGGGAPPSSSYGLPVFTEEDYAALDEKGLPSGIQDVQSSDYLADMRKRIGKMTETAFEQRQQAENQPRRQFAPQTDPSLAPRINETAKLEQDVNKFRLDYAKDILAATPEFGPQWDAFLEGTLKTLLDNYEHAFQYSGRPDLKESYYRRYRSLKKWVDDTNAKFHPGKEPPPPPPAPEREPLKLRRDLGFRRGQRVTKAELGKAILQALGLTTPGPEDRADLMRLANEQITKLGLIVGPNTPPAATQRKPMPR